MQKIRADTHNILRFALLSPLDLEQVGWYIK